MNSYASQYPAAVAFDPAYTQFFERFYATSDTPEAHEDYVKYFTQDATLIMASKKVVGPEGAWSFAFFIEPCDETSPPFRRSETLFPVPRADSKLAEILSLRKAMWEKVSSRAHAPLKIFPFGPNANEVMLYGTVKYGLKVGGESSKDWAARAHLVKEDDGNVKMSFYQVYLVRHSASACMAISGL